MTISNVPNPLQVSLGASPKEGPKSIFYALDFTAQSTQTADLTAIQQATRISAIQTVYVDNSANTAALNMFVATTNQTLTCPGKSQGYFSLIVSDKLSVTFTSSSGAVIYIELLNVAMNTTVWAATTPPSTDVNGNLLVRDTVLDSAVAGGYFQSENFDMVSGGVLTPHTIPSKMITTNLKAAGAISPFVGLPGFKVRNLSVTLTPNATLATAGVVTVQVYEAGSPNIVIDTQQVFIPTTAVTGLTGPIPIIKWDNLDYTSKYSGSQFVLSSDTALATGQFNMTVGYSQQAFVGG